LSREHFEFFLPDVNYHWTLNSRFIKILSMYCFSSLCNFPD
jgi:hypothetical protein